MIRSKFRFILPKKKKKIFKNESKEKKDLK